jgi:erythromycin esterase
MKQLIYFILATCVLTSQGQISKFGSIEWQDLKKRIGNDSIVGLGEIAHGYESINEAKSTLVEFLHTQLNFQAITFESSFTESIISFLSNDSLDKRAKNFLYPFWNTTSVKAAIKPFSGDEKTLAQPLILGFDIQEDCRFEKFSEYLSKTGLIVLNKKKQDECDSILSLYIGKSFDHQGEMTQREYSTLIHNYDAIAAELSGQNFDTLQKKLLGRCINNRKWLCKYLTFSTIRERMYYRDSLMAVNIKWLKDELYSKNKLIIWAANTHISKFSGKKKPKWNGQWLASIYLDKYFNIAFQKGTSDNRFLWENASFKYFNGQNKKFDMIIYLDKLRKIKADEWITSCD